MQVNKSKKTIAFLPGFGFKACIWQSIANQFADINVILVDLPSAPTSNTEIIQTINQQLPHDCMLIAWSLGGMIATHLCFNFPDKYQKLVLVASTPKWIATTDWHGMSEKNISTFYNEAQENLPQLMQTFSRLVNGKNRNHNLRNIMQSHAIDLTQEYTPLFYLDLLKTSDVRELLSQLNMPVCHIFGGEDVLVPADCALALKKKHAHHTIHMIQSAGHIPFITHAPEFMHHLLRFIHHD